jgi:murein DD-endopeptidase MepM/ murein hydrolase activator NlpD
MMKALLTILLLTVTSQDHIFLPVAAGDRKNISAIRLTDIGQFALIRKAMKNVPAHYHTGIDIRRPNNNYESEPVFPIAKGVLISKRTDGPYANLIIEHEINGEKIWSVYEHIAGIRVKVRDLVSPENPIARFMNKEELNRFGWQFNHFHFELIKVKPVKKEPDTKNPERFYNSYALVCHTPDDLNKYFYDPMEFLRARLEKK